MNIEQKVSFCRKKSQIRIIVSDWEMLHDTLSKIMNGKALILIFVEKIISDLSKTQNIYPFTVFK